MKNERRNTKTKTTSQNTERVWAAPVEKVHGEHVTVWIRQENQSVPRRAGSRSTARTSAARRRPARDVLGTSGKAYETIERVIGVSISPDGRGAFVTNNRTWITDEESMNIWPATHFLHRWKRWCRGELNLQEI